MITSGYKVKINAFFNTNSNFLDIGSKMQGHCFLWNSHMNKEIIIKKSVTCKPAVPTNVGPLALVELKNEGNFNSVA